MDKKQEKIRDLAKPADLNDEQEVFAREIVKGLGRLEALRKAYPNSKYSDKAGYVRASKLLSEERVVKRIEELQMIVLERALKESQYNLEVGTKELMNLVTLAREDIETKGISKAKSDIIIACIQELNRMYKLTGTTGSMNLTNKDGGKILFVNATDVMD